MMAGDRESEEINKYNYYIGPISSYLVDISQLVANFCYDFLVCVVPKNMFFVYAAKSLDIYQKPAARRWRFCGFC